MANFVMPLLLLLLLLLLLCNGIRTLNQNVKVSNELFLLTFMLV
jgi:hypothetical protein